MDKISIKGLQLFAFHGVKSEEKRDGQTYVIDIDLHTDLIKPCHSDDINETVDYEKVVKTVQHVFTKERYNLIEKCAEVIADAILDEFKEVQTVEVTLKKPEAPMNADFDYMGVSIIRNRE